jgi:RNA polymerase primary sigma factor
MHASNKESALVAHTPQPQPQLDRQALAADNVGFAVYKAKRFHYRLLNEAGLLGEEAGPTIELRELIGAAKEGLMVAAEKYDPSRGTKFITFAAIWIRKRLQQANQDFQAHSQTVSLDEELDDTGGGSVKGAATLHDSTIDTGALMPWEVMERRETAAALEATLAGLSEQEHAVIDWSVGLEGDKLNQAQIAARLRINERTVRKILTRALQKMKDNWQGSGPYFGPTYSESFKSAGAKVGTKVGSD